jgi:hypothetical protein
VRDFVPASGKHLRQALYALERSDRRCAPGALAGRSSAWLEQFRGGACSP